MSKKKTENRDKDQQKIEQSAAEAAPAQTGPGAEETGAEAAPATAAGEQAPAAETKAEAEAAADAAKPEADAAAHAEADTPAVNPALVITRAKSKSIAPPLFIVVFLLVAWTGAGGYLLWQEQRGIKTTLDEQDSRTRELADRTAAAQQEGGQLAERLDRAENQLSKVITTDLDALQAQQHTIEGLLETLRDKMERNSQVWITSEAAYLMRLANDRLRLDADLPTTIAALQAADQRLEEFGDPSLFEVRRALAVELTELRGIELPDTTGLALQLSALSDAVDRLPFPHAPATEDTTELTEEAGWRKVAHDMWQELKKLVVIKQKGQAEPALLAPDERYFLQQNLRLKLEAARLAVVRRDTQLFHDSLQRAQEWILLYYDPEAGPTKAALNELADLQRIDLKPALPDIAGSLRALQDWQTQRRNKKSGEGAP